MICRPVRLALLALPLLTLALAGCAANIGEDDGVTAFPVATGAPLVGLPPQAGRVVGVTEVRKGSTVTQTIALQADAGAVGQNQLVVTSAATASRRASVRTRSPPRWRSTFRASPCQSATP